jgi:DNA primase
MKKFDVEKYVRSNLERVKKGSTGQLSATCPFCEKYGSFYIDVDSGNYICFKCEQRGRYLVGVVSCVENVSYNEAKRFILRNVFETRRKETVPSLIDKIRGLREKEEHEEEEKIIPLPKEFIPVYAKKKWRFPKYLKSRGIRRETARSWGFGYCNRGRYRNRIIIPIRCPAGESFTSRDVTGLLKPKYLNPICPFQSHLLIGWSNLGKGDIVLVEGPLDAVKMWQHGFNCLALGGKILHSEQIKMICSFPKDTSITIMLDPEELKAPIDVAKQLIFHFDQVFVATLPEGVDPGNSTKEQAEEAFEDSEIYIGERGKELSANLFLLRKKIKRCYC